MAYCSSNYFVGNHGQMKPPPQLYLPVPFKPTLELVVEGEGGLWKTN